MAKGIRIIKDGWGDQDSVLVKYPDGAEMRFQRANTWLRDITHRSTRCQCALLLRLPLAKRKIPMHRGPNGEKRPIEVNGRAAVIA